MQAEREKHVFREGTVDATVITDSIKIPKNRRFFIAERGCLVFADTQLGPSRWGPKLSERISLLRGLLRGVVGGDWAGSR